MVYLYNEIRQELDYQSEGHVVEPCHMILYVMHCWLIGPNKVNLLSPIYIINKLHIAPTFKIIKRLSL